MVQKKYLERWVGEFFQKPVSSWWSYQIKSN